MAAKNMSETWNPSSEFPEFSRNEIQHYQKMFKHHDSDRDKFLNASEFRKMAVKAKVTDLADSDIAAMIRELDEDRDGKISFREFLLIFHKAPRGLLRDPGLIEIYDQMHVPGSETHENNNQLLAEFKNQLDEWGKTEEGTKI